MSTKTAIGKIEFANSLRGFAALAVVISHYLGVFWLYRGAAAGLINAPILPDSYGVPFYVRWLNAFTLLRWGPFGVALFFLISGFVIPFSLHRKNSIEFLIQRFFRIVPTYCVGFSISLIAIAICTHYFATAWPFSRQEILLHYLPGIRDLFASRGIDGIVWTLEIEIKFYLVVACAIVWFQKNSSKVFLIPVFLFFLACLCNHYLPHLQQRGIVITHLTMAYLLFSDYMIFMFIGTVFYYMYIDKLEPQKGYMLVAVLFTLFCIEWQIGPYNAGFFSAWSYGFALLFFMAANLFPDYFRANIITNFLANISYPLYVTHAVAGYVALRILLDMGTRPSLALALVISLSLPCAYLLHRWIEKPSQNFGKKWAKFCARYLARPQQSLDENSALVQG